MSVFLEMGVEPSGLVRGQWPGWDNAVSSSALLMSLGGSVPYLKGEQLYVSILNQLLT